MSEVRHVESQELQALRRALGDMAALSSLPAMWVNADEERIAASLADCADAGARSGRRAGNLRN